MISHCRHGRKAAGPHSEPGYAMCIQTSGAGGAKLTGIIYYAQF